MFLGDTSAGPWLPSSKCQHKVTAPLYDILVHIFSANLGSQLCHGQPLITVPRFIQSTTGMEEFLAPAGQCPVISLTTLRTLLPPPMKHPGLSISSVCSHSSLCFPNIAHPKVGWMPALSHAMASPQWELLRARDLSCSSLNLPVPST